MNHQNQDPQHNKGTDQPNYTHINKNEGSETGHTRYIHRAEYDSESEAQQREHHIDALENLDDWKVHHDDTDIRGWELYTITGEKIGTITNLIADTEAKRVLYLEVETDSGLSQYNTNAYHDYVDESFHTYYETQNYRHILVPIGMVDIDNDNKKVDAASNLTPAHFASSPRFEGIKRQRITPIYQLLTAKHYAQGDDYYRSYYDEADYNVYDYDKSNAITNPRFYQSDFFHRDRYRNRLQNKNIAGFDTGSKKYNR